MGSAAGITEARLDDASEFRRSLGYDLRRGTRLLRVTPVGFSNGVRLYAAYVVGGPLRLLTGPRFPSVGAFLFGRSPLEVSFEGVRALVRPRSEDLSVLAGVHEPSTSGWFTVESGEVVVDVGAHIGRYTLVAAKRAAKVLSIEPDPDNFALLTANVRLNGFSNVVALEVAVGNSAGAGTLYQGDHASTRSLNPEWAARAGELPPVRSTPVRVETLDRLAENHGIGAVDWLKVDVEGSEVPALEGGVDLLSRTRRLLLEVSRSNITVCERLVHRAGFRLVASERWRLAENWYLKRA